MNKGFLGIFVIFIINGCASVPLHSETESTKAKQFNAPDDGQAGLYVYRKTFLLHDSKKDMWLNGECIGETASDIFFYEQVEEGTHTLSTESEFSPNKLTIEVKAGKNYFVQQQMRPGIFVPGAYLKLIDAEKA